ncbi:ATP-binding protein [Aetokthonos hydrillicola Thurmond2011]|jgi:PAS domain S-box-containing protein|uniref:histidine kinase n=1 Tax=Aetokthonos hydrillicola Thurmond2011 TaxID=2712845 RepID=A0AAP5I1X4_9CYAN|nr:ATP-binding protein [Aetokthonos hydrillicola]MBO3463695.1 amino acid permease [Aetokthonos hydrillicola CCALA 1050]MBW4589598.1 amino acid permease [Aetokthonos hydrillicola CCALA 1050]MDR9893200.1 ATP-binding protein [Aetokthonos hydrillicola Thurmond2011]
MPSHETPLLNQLYPSLTRSLSAAETWGFGLTGHILWITVIPAIHAALGSRAIFVWIPAVALGMLLNYQVKRLGYYFINVAGGTPNYASKLLQRYPTLAQYAALGYFFSWVSVLPVNAIVLTDLITVNMEALGIACPKQPLEIGFTLLPFILAFSGTRSLSILHLFFVIPAFGLLLIFSGQGLCWLALSPASPGFFPDHLLPLGLIDWAKWFLFVTFATYACETASAFVADSRRPEKTLNFLGIAAWLMIPVYLGGSWVVMRLARVADLQDSTFLNLLAASKPFWGGSAELIVTFLLTASCLLASATVVSNCPRIIYQLAQDKQLSPVFGVVSRRGVFGAALTLTLVISLICLIWRNVPEIIVVGNTSWFISIMAVHLGLWLQRSQSEVLLPRISLGIFLLEVLVLVVGGLAWGWQDFFIGLLIPIGIMGIDKTIRHIRFPFFRPRWWMQRYHSRPLVSITDSLILQVSTLIVLLCSAVWVGWLFGLKLDRGNVAIPLGAVSKQESLFLVLLITVAFVGVGIACWTTLPQVVAMAEARESAEHLFMVAQDAIVVVDHSGVLQQVNPATHSLFGLNSSQMLGYPLTKWLPGLIGYPHHWKKRSEQTLNCNNQVKTFEVSVSDIPHQDFQEYVVILHDITKRKHAQEILQESEAELRKRSQQLAAQLVQSEKMSSLGQMVAGLAHEINNPISFIQCNLEPAHEYTQDLIRLLQLYEKHYPNPATEIQAEREAVDVDFLVTDLPKLVQSMSVGTERITKIVLSLRNFSRLDEAEMKAVDIHEGIDSTLMILQHRLNASGIRPAIEVIKEYGNLPQVECYAGQLNQVFMNILANAIDALDEAMKNREENASSYTPQIRIYTAITEKNQVIIRFADNGQGIPESLKKRLFDPFFTTKPVGKGTGLGLSISYQIITQKHQGTLECISSVGKGAEFAISIPLNQNG